ncbi:MAG: HNH endonuclease signature motif containing protein [Planctomycetota bacterium]
MALAPLRKCSEPTCRKLVRTARCEKHTKERAKHSSKNRPGDPFYSSKRWRETRAAKLREDPLCEKCRPRVVAASVVDHILDRCDRPDLAYDMHNLMSLCVSCHNRKTAKTMAKRRRDRGG